MSMQRGCIIVKYSDTEYWCIVARLEYDYEFRYFNVYGPKTTEEEAFDEMNSYECNPGSFIIVPVRELGNKFKDAIEKEKKCPTEKY
jgi:hypothetical protein